MRNGSRHRHMIDFLFPAAVFFLFALSAVTVVLLAAEIYQSSTENSSLNYTARTSLSYVCEKVHQSDAAGAVFIGTFDGCDALVMEQDYEGETYCTYLYVCEQELRELFMKEGTEAGADSGRTIMEVQDFTMEQISGGLLEFTCTDMDNREASAVVGIRSR